MWFFPDIHRQTIVSNLKPAYGQIDINALPQGVYFIMVTTIDRVVSVVKFVKIWHQQRTSFENGNDGLKILFVKRHKNELFISIIKSFFHLFKIMFLVFCKNVLFCQIFSIFYYNLHTAFYTFVPNFKKNVLQARKVFTFKIKRFRIQALLPAEK